MQTAKHKFGRDVLISGTATGVRLLRHVLILPVLTHGLDEIQLGLWEQVMVGIALVIPWISLQLPGALVRFLPGIKDLNRQRDIAYSLFFLSLGSSTALGLLLGWGCYFALADTRWSLLLPVLPLITALTVATTSLESVRTYFRALRLMLRHSAISIAQYFGELVLIAYVFLAGGDIAAGLSALLAIRTGLFLCGAIAVVMQLGWARPSFTNTHEFLSFSIPLIPNSALYRLFDAGDRYLLAYYLGHAAVGVYFVSYTAASLFATLVSPLHMVLLPAIAELWNSGQKEKIAEYLSDIILYTIVLSLPLFVLVVLIPGEILGLLTPGAYVESALYLPVLALGFLSFSLGVPADQLLVAAGKTRLLFFINSGMAIGNIALNLLLIPQIGIWGAAISTLAGHLLYSLTALTLARRIIAFGLPWRSLLKATCSAILMGLLLTVAKAEFPILVVAISAGAAYLLMCFASGILGKREWLYLRQLLQRN